MKTKLQYAWSENETLFNSETFDTRIAALEDVQHSVDSDTVVYIGKVKELRASDLISAGRILDEAQELAYELASEASEDFLEHVTRAQEDKLQVYLAAAFAEWL